MTSCAYIGLRDLIEAAATTQSKTSPSIGNTTTKLIAASDEILEVFHRDRGISDIILRCQFERGLDISERLFVVRILKSIHAYDIMSKESIDRLRGVVSIGSQNRNLILTNRNVSWSTVLLRRLTPEFFSYRPAFGHQVTRQFKEGYSCKLILVPRVACHERAQFGARKPGLDFCLLLQFIAALAHIPALYRRPQYPLVASSHITSICSIYASVRTIYLDKDYHQGCTFTSFFL